MKRKCALGIKWKEDRALQGWGSGRWSQAVYLLKRKHRLYERQVGSLTIEYEVGALKVEGGEAFGGRRYLIQ